MLTSAKTARRKVSVASRERRALGLIGAASAIHPPRVLLDVVADDGLPFSA